MERIINQDLEAKFFGAELRSNLPNLDLHPPFELDQTETALDQFFYQQVQAGEEVVAVIYGGGKGVLRKAVLKALENNPLVAGVKDKNGHCLVALEKADI